MEGGFGLGGGSFADGVIELADGMVLGGEGGLVPGGEVGIDGAAQGIGGFAERVEEDAEVTEELLVDDPLEEGLRELDETHGVEAIPGTEVLGKEGGDEELGKFVDATPGAPDVAGVGGGDVPEDVATDTGCLAQQGGIAGEGVRLGVVGDLVPAPHAEHHLAHGVEGIGGHAARGGLGLPYGLLEPDLADAGGGDIARDDTSYSGQLHHEAGLVGDAGLAAPYALVVARSGDIDMLVAVVYVLIAHPTGCPGVGRDGPDEVHHSPIVGIGGLGGCPCRLVIEEGEEAGVGYAGDILACQFLGAIDEEEAGDECVEHPFGGLPEGLLHIVEGTIGHAVAPVGGDILEGFELLAAGGTQYPPLLAGLGKRGGKGLQARGHGAHQR